MLFDLICLGIALLLTLLGLFRGLVRQLFGVAGFVGGLVLAHLFAAPFAVEFSAQLGLSPALATIAFSIAIFFAVEVVASLLGNFLHDHLGVILGTLNRLGGGVLGLAKGLLVVWALASLAAVFVAHLTPSELLRSPLAKLDLSRSAVVRTMGSANFLGDVNAQLRAAGKRS